MYYLSDISNANFARKKGSKDKTKRQPVNVKKAALIGGLGYGGLNALSLAHPMHRNLTPQQKLVGGVLAAGLGAGVGAGIAKIRNRTRTKNQ